MKYLLVYTHTHTHTEVHQSLFALNGRQPQIFIIMELRNEYCYSNTEYYMVMLTHRLQLTNSIDEIQKHTINIKKPGTKEYILYGFHVYEV